MMKSIFTIILFVFPLVLFADEFEIDKIQFLNVRFDGEEELEDIIQSEEGENFEARLIKLDKILLTNYYKKFGFLDVEIRDSVQYKKRKKAVKVFYSIYEGQRYFYGGVRTRGNQQFAARELAELFDDSRQYDPFDENLVTQSIKKVENLYYNSGKPYVEVDVNYLYEQDSLIVVLVDIEENETVYIQKIRYNGLKLVKKFLIRRELEFAKGDRYDRSKIDKSQKNLYGTGLFKYVRFEMEPIPGQAGQTILHIMVQEKDPRWVGARFGVAHEQETFYGNKFEITLQGGHRNLFGTARSVSLHATPSLDYDFSENKFRNPDNKISFRFVEPWILNTRTPGIFQLGYEQYRPRNSGNFDLWKTSFDLKRQINSYTQVTGSISAKLVDLVGSTEIDSSIASTVQADKSEVYSITLYWKRDKRKNLFNPTNSSYTDASMSFSYTEGQNDDGTIQTNNYIILNASWQRYMPWRPKLPYFKRGKFTFASRLKSGMIIEPAGKGEIPINDLFFAGGATTVRGYEEQLLGPAADVNDKGQITKAAGGKFIVLGNVEARIPLFWIFVLEIFVDSGFVWPEIEDFNYKDFKFSAGTGLAAITPLGPVRLDYGYKLISDKTDPEPDAFHIGIYFAF